MFIIRQSLVVWLLLTLLTGLAYPMLVTALAQKLFPFQANGSLIKQGSSLIGQTFTAPEYFWGRPVRAALGPSNPQLVKELKKDIGRLKSEEVTRIPVDLVTASASQVDPHISPEAAYYQVMRIARIRKIPNSKIEGLIQKHIEKRTLGVLGEPRVNVLLLNQELDNLGV